VAPGYFWEGSKRVKKGISLAVGFWDFDVHNYGGHQVCFFRGTFMNNFGENNYGTQS
jgi:hypothetical protein